jgi:hypothetical protein
VIPPSSIHGNPCSVATQLPILEAKDPELYEDILSWFANPITANDAQVYDVLQKCGLRVGQQTIGRHRRHQCRCYR